MAAMCSRSARGGGVIGQSSARLTGRYIYARLVKESKLNSEALQPAVVVENGQAARCNDGSESVTVRHQQRRRHRHSSRLFLCSSHSLNSSSNYSICSGLHIPFALLHSSLRKASNFFGSEPLSKLWSSPFH